ncbi:MULTISPECIES: MgtC/SapB family protein [unclassified Schaalia]|uniref:MgtC/SapB family protein n=1 Tax=unclassified Schaalia TaxID=2691889 RepID=UPI001E65554C|nr:MULTISPECIES: MgtC/SapB family protein [unclassified Schaalia]MCD4548962.1 MgtC/SapB family protein [Schaalia sp. lx-260]MCD4557572.1 MgtC/SapB family protein [Schaalia sp. lx-100]
MIYAVQLGLVLLALVLSACIGLERQQHGKSAGIRTQAIVGFTAAIMMLISKYGFLDVVGDGITKLDPSRVAAQIVSGIGFLGAGIILTRHGTIKGLTTAATIWETAAIGMACGAGLWWLALAGTALHFLVVFAIAPGLIYLTARIMPDTHTLLVEYTQGHGVLGNTISHITLLGWSIVTASSTRDRQENDVTARLTVRSDRGLNISTLIAAVADIEGIHAVSLAETDDD